MHSRVKLLQDSHALPTRTDTSGEVRESLKWGGSGPFLVQGAVWIRQKYPSEKSVVPPHSRLRFGLIPL
ncbi:hypothetical protein OPQ81_000937 [Rhizoctonia solani]|nr:hypothetical protein OPQ81_000937 [Rhizoctonia solani]